MPPGIISPRQLELGPPSFFQVRAEEPAANQVSIKAGLFTRAAFAIGQNTLWPADQASAGFAVVTPGFQRIDLLALDNTGALTIVQGYEVAVASPLFQGAPGWTGTNPGVRIPDGLIPIAYILVDETAAVTVTESDITAVNAFYLNARDHEGYLVDKGLFGSAPSGASDDVSTLFAGDTRVSSSGGTEPDSGGSSSQAGVVTGAPENYVHVVDQNGDEILHNTGARMYGRLTEAAGTWTLTYFYLNASGVETSMDPSADTAGAAPTDLRLVGVPRVYSRNDPARPLFDSNVARLSDQIVGTIPDGSETQKGKVQFAANLDTASLEAVQGSDDRVNSPIQGKNSGGAAVGGRYDSIKEGSGITLSDGGGGDLVVSAGAGVGYSVAQVVETTHGDRVTLASSYNTGDAVPTNTGGTEISALNTNFTPGDANSIILVEVCLLLGGGPGAHLAALFRGADATARASMVSGQAVDQTFENLTFTFQMLAGSTSTHTWKIRAGDYSGASSIYLNGDGGGRKLGGNAYSYMRITELRPI